MLREFTCIICPNGCDIEVELNDDGTIKEIQGAQCPNGVRYVEQELVDPQRTISTSVLVENGELPLVSVRLSKPIPKKYIFPVMDEIKKVVLTAPVYAGDIVIEDVLGLGSDVIATKDVGIAP